MYVYIYIYIYINVYLLILNIIFKVSSTLLYQLNTPTLIHTSNDNYSIFRRSEVL